MLIAVTTAGSGLNAVVPESFEQSAELLIIETDSDTVIATYERRDGEGLFFAEQTIAHDCEAIVCGKLQSRGFEVIASNNITRYYGAGLPAVQAAHAAEDDQLPLTTYPEGGNGGD